MRTQTPTRQADPTERTAETRRTTRGMRRVRRAARKGARRAVHVYLSCGRFDDALDVA